MYFLKRMYALRAILVAFACATVAADSVAENETSDYFASGLQVMFQTYQQCKDEKIIDPVSCLKMRALKLTDKLARSESISLLEGVSIVKVENVKERTGKKMEERELPELNMASLPMDDVGRQRKMDEMIATRLVRFFQTHTLQLDMSKFLNESARLLSGDIAQEDNQVSEERGKKKKKYGALLLLGGLMKGGMIALGMKKLALIAGKALIIAKIALVIASIVGLSKFMNKGGGEEKTTYEIIKHPHVSHEHSYSSSYGDEHEHHGGGHYRRSFDPSAAHPLAYRSQMPEWKPSPVDPVASA